MPSRGISRRDFHHSFHWKLVRYFKQAVIYAVRFIYRRCLDHFIFLMGISLYLVWSKNWQISMPADSQTQKVWNRFSEKLWFGTWREENAVLIFILQLVLNVLWSVIFFGLKLPGLAFFELLMLWFAILYTIVNFYRISKPASYLLLLYIFWVSFAGYLNFLVWRMN